MVRPARFLRPGLAASALLLALPAAFGQAFDAVRLYGGAPGEEVGLVGAVLIAGTEYAGSDQRQTRLVPLLDYLWKNGWFAGTANGIGVNLSRREDMQYGVRLTADFGRDQDNSAALRGMGDIDPRLEIGAFFNKFMSREIFLSSSLRYGAGGSGLIVDFGAGYSTALAPTWRLGFGGAFTLINADYAQTYFGVSPSQSASSGYAVHQPGAGVRDARANVALTYLFNRHTSLTTAVSAGTLLGDVADSPLVRQQTTVSGVAVLSYAF